MVLKKLVALFGLGLVLIGMGTGCSTKPQMEPRDVRVTLDDSLRDASGKLKSVQVDIKAVNPNERDRWINIPVDEFWAPGSTLASSPNVYVMKFNYQENVATKLLPKTDPIWGKWAADGAMDLVVIATIPGLSGNGAGTQDPRRLVFPLDSHRWDELDELKINVSRSGISSPNRPKELKK